MTADTCAMHGGPLVWCERCIAMERKYAALDVAELVGDVERAVALLLIQYEQLEPEDRLWLGQAQRRVIDRKRAATQEPS